MRTRPQKIPVTEKMIETAQRADSGHCMIADAIKAANPAWTHIAVDLQTIRVTDKEHGQRLVWLTPLALQQQLLRFDQGVEVEPFAFKLPRIVAQVIPVEDRSAWKQDAPKQPPQEPAAKKPPQKRQESALKTNEGRIPTVHGGKEPPAAVLSHSRGRRRVFGIRAAKGFNPNE